MKIFYFFSIVGAFFAMVVFSQTSVAKSTRNDFTTGTPDIKSMGTLTFNSDGVLFIGDSKSAAVFAIDLMDQTPSNKEDGLEVRDIESKIASMLGTTADEILIHDLAVNPISKSAYMSVSLARSKWESRWQLPNELDDARILLRVTPAGEIQEVSLQNVRYSRAVLPNPVAMDAKHKWKKGTTLRVDTITDMVYADGRLYVAGLSNEEFASTMWLVDFPFKNNAIFTTLEIYHAAHGAYETHAPIRTFLAYKVNNSAHILASYLCTPLVSFPIADLKNKTHLKGKTLAEFGSGNYPLDMVLYQKDGQDLILMANSALPLMVIDPKDIEKQTEGLTSDPDTYTAGVPYTAKSGGSIQQLANFNAKNILALQRTPAGKLDLISLPTRRLAK